MGEHDENITFERTVELVGAADAAALRDASPARSSPRRRAIAEARGVILADTKFEFGATRRRASSPSPTRCSPATRAATGMPTSYAAGGTDRLDSFDKQIVRDWLAANWDKTGTPPTLPHEIVEQTAARYRELIERLTA